MTVYYRTQDGMADYKFSFERRSDEKWTVYILEQPTYGSRATDAVSTHRLTDALGRYYVCWNLPLGTQSDAQRVAAIWADATQVYIQTGRFPDGDWMRTWEPKF